MVFILKWQAVVLRFVNMFQKKFKMQPVQQLMALQKKKKLKTVAGSSNNEVANAISASAQEQNNEVMAQQGDALSLEALEDWIASFTVEEIDRKNYA